MSDTSESVETPGGPVEPAKHHDGVTDSAPADASPAGDPADDRSTIKETILQLRQIAGLTAGSVMELHTGSFQFRESNKDVGFSLVVSGSDDVVVVPGAAAAMVDEIPVVDPTPLGSSVLNVGSACFAVRPPRPERNPLELAEKLESARRPAKAITVPEFEDGEKLDVQTKSSRFGSLFARSPEGEEPTLDTADWAFLEAIRDARGVMAERHRYLHPNPEELRSRLDRLDPGLWDRTIEHPLFARLAVAYSTIPWEPRFDDPNRIPAPLHQPIQEMSCLPWVPITANLLFGPLAIVGTRSATLACARSAVLALACLTSPNDIEFSIVTAQGLVDDWNWTSSLPNSLFPTGSNNYCVAVADGMTHFEGAGFDIEAVANNEMGLIVLAESLEELPDGCGTIVEITPDGQCRVTNHLDEQIVGTPIGVTADFAAATASIIREAVGDGEQEELFEQNAASDPQFTAEDIPPTPAPTESGPSGTDVDGPTDPSVDGRSDGTDAETDRSGHDALAGSEPNATDGDAETAEPSANAGTGDGDEPSPDDRELTDSVDNH